MVNIAPKLDIPILDVTLLHRCKHVVWPMGSRAIEISEILQVGPIPCKAIAAIDQDAGTASDGLGLSQPNLKIQSVFEKIESSGKPIAVQGTTHPLPFCVEMSVRRTELGPPKVVSPRRRIVIGRPRVDCFHFDMKLFLIARGKEIDAAPMRQKVGLIGDTVCDERIISQYLCDDHLVDALGELPRGIAGARIACSNSDLELPPQDFTTIEPTGRPGHDRRVDSSHLLHEFFQNIVQDGSLEWRAENLRSAQLAAILHRLTQISARSGQEQISADVKQARPKTGRPSRSLCLRERPPCSQLGAGPL